MSISISISIPSLVSISISVSISIFSPTFQGFFLAYVLSFFSFCVPFFVFHFFLYVCFFCVVFVVFVVDYITIHYDDTFTFTSLRLYCFDWGRIVLLVLVPYWSYRAIGAIGAMH